jgi:type IX secretion system substrate protein
LFYSQTGSPRGSISNTWTDYPTMDWGVAQLNGYDIKHADCNGDGTIDDNDTLAVNLNFSSVHAFTPLPDNNAERLTAPPMYWLTSSAVYSAGATVIADLYIGNASIPVSSMYGISFDVDYPSSMVQPGSEIIMYPNSWLGSPGIDAIKLSKVDGSVNTAFGAVTRINQVNAAGYGKVASYRFVLNSLIPATTSLTLNVAAYTAIEANGDTILFNSLPYTITVDPFTGITEANNDVAVNIYPNPYYGSTTISYMLDKASDVTIEVYNAIGQNIHTIRNGSQPAGKHDNRFSAKEIGMNAGVYFVKITIDGKITMRRIVEMK